MEALAGELQLGRCQERGVPEWMQALLTFVYFLEELQGLLIGAMWGFRRRQLDRGSRLSSTEGLNSEFERSNRDSHLRGQLDK